MEENQKVVKFIEDDIDITKIDFLGHDKLADSILKAIELANPPFTLAIYGCWGTGKTKLMERAKSKLEKEKYTPIWFDTWEYESEPNLLWPLLKLIREKALYFNWGDVEKQQVEKIFKAVSRCVLDIGTRVSAKLLSGGILEYKLQDIEEQLAKEDTPLDLYQDKVQYLKEQFNEYIKLILKKTKQDKLIIFFDDLDRCSPDKVIELLESVKLFLYRGDCVFIFALDKKIVSEAITKKYIEMESFDGERYLEKIFGFSFNLTSPEEEQLKNITEKQFKFLDDTILTIKEKKSELLKLLETSNRNNPRILKRFFNKLIFLTKVYPNREELNFGLLGWIFIFEFWPDFRKLLNKMEGSSVQQYMSNIFKDTPSKVSFYLNGNPSPSNSDKVSPVFRQYPESQKYFLDAFLYNTLKSISIDQTTLYTGYEKAKEICETYGL